MNRMEMEKMKIIIKMITVIKYKIKLFAKLQEGFWFIKEKI